MFSAGTEYSRPRERDEKESPFFVPQERGFRREKEPSLFFFRACRQLTAPLTPRPRPHLADGPGRRRGSNRGRPRNIGHVEQGQYERLSELLRFDSGRRIIHALRIRR